MWVFSIKVPWNTWDFFRFYFMKDNTHVVYKKEKIGQICACLAPMIERNKNFP